MSEGKSAWLEFTTQNPCKKIKVMAHISNPNIPTAGWEVEKEKC